MLRPLAGRIALVTGGGTGVGAAVAVGLAERGASVLINYSRSAREAEETARQCEAAGSPEGMWRSRKGKKADVSRTPSGWRLRRARTRCGPSRAPRYTREQRGHHAAGTRPLGSECADQGRLHGRLRGQHGRPLLSPAAAEAAAARGARRERPGERRAAHVVHRGPRRQGLFSRVHRLEGCAQLDDHRHGARPGAPNPSQRALPRLHRHALVQGAPCPCAKLPSPTLPSRDRHARHTSRAHAGQRARARGTNPETAPPAVRRT